MATSKIRDITYSIQGLADFQRFSSLFVLSGSASDTAPGMPSLALSGWEYRTFKLNSSEGLVGKGFLRVQVRTPSSPLWRTGGKRFTLVRVVG